MAALVQIALLRAVNVGGRGSLKMSDLRAVAEGLGFTNVRTLLQSGNLVFEAKGKPAALERALEAALKRERGIETDFLIRGAKELAAVIDANPFPEGSKVGAGPPGGNVPEGSRRGESRADAATSPQGS